jgi:hypothetical protein
LEKDICEEMGQTCINIAEVEKHIVRDKPIIENVGKALEEH